MQLLEKAQPVWVLVSVGLGLTLAQGSSAGEVLGHWVQPLLALLLYLTFLGIPIQQFRQLSCASRVVWASLCINFLWTPLLAWGLGALFLSDLPDLWVGLIMLMVTPCTDWYLVFTGLAGGDGVLATALLPLNWVLQLLLLPVYLLLLVGDLVQLQPGELLTGLLWVLGLPFLAALLTQFCGPYLREKLGWLGSPTLLSALQLLSLNLAIVCIFTAEGRLLMQNPALFFRLLAPVLLFFVVNFWLAQRVGRWLDLTYPQLACLTCTTLARNSPLALAVAAAAFPERPLIVLALVVGPLIELPVLSWVVQMLLHLRRRGGWRQN
ncbi:MAG: hypothetical protein Q6K80_05445 [Thermostichus sp. DG_1_6_bins_120]